MFMKQVIDNFSAGSDEYALYRPQSPAAVYEFLFQHVKRREAAWDCGTGNGQVASVLADHFNNVYATDISSEQMEKAPRLSNITYLKERAEQTTLPDARVDLVTVAQAIHWFDFDKFYDEVYRVARPGALFAAWTYVVLRVNKEVDAVIDKLYTITDAYWNPERRYVDAHYQTIPFPFEEIKTPEFQIVKPVALEGLLGYLKTWSGVKNYKKALNEDPIAMIADEMAAAWGDNELLNIRWPVYMRAGFVR
jgi:SAM-dependent methyltransferase